MSYDLGDVVTLAIQIKDASNVLANAGAVVATVTLPDGTTTAPSVTNGSTGNYSLTYTPTLPGRHSIRWVATGANAGAYTDTFDVEDPADLGLVSFADAKAHLQIPTTDTTLDDNIRGIILAATSLAEGYTGRALRRTTVVETKNGADPVSPFRGKYALDLLRTPVISITTVVENSTTLAATDYTLSPDSGMLYRGGQFQRMPWLPGVQNVTVTYVAGFANPPEGLVMAVKRIIENLYDRTQIATHPAFDASGGTEFEPASTHMLPYAVQSALDPYTIHGF